MTALLLFILSDTLETMNSVLHLSAVTERSHHTYILATTGIASSAKAHHVQTTWYGNQSSPIHARK